MKKEQEIISAITPISDIIKFRLEHAGQGYLSTDNISEHIKDGELEKLIDEVQMKVEGVLSSLIINTSDDHNTHDTARRIAKMYILETFSGRFKPKPIITDFPNAKHFDELMVTGPITIRSVCAHHFQNISGVAYIGLAPGSRVIGLSKFNRITDWFASRPTIQEELTVQIADAIEDITDATGCAVLIKAEHGCMTARGVKEHQSNFTTSVVRGSLRNNPLMKDEFFKMISIMQGSNS